MNFSNVLIYWYLQNKRDLPWRNTKNPYAIWLSEIILQQTRVEQGLPYYEAFLSNFPTVFDLAKADEEIVLKLWQGLGYYSRARNLHFSAKYIVNDLAGQFPITYNEIIKLKGVGDYTASAIASICYNEPTAVVDGNAYRVLARYYGIKTAINSTKGIKEFKTLAQTLIDHEQAGTYNQAIMEFGARQCKPQNPDCGSCPLNESCVSLEKNIVSELPVKEKKLKVKKRYFNYLVIDGAKTVLKKRTKKGIWQNLFEFPLIETLKNIDVEALVEHTDFKELFNKNNTSIQLFNQEPIIHKLSHQHLYTKFWIVKPEKELENSILWSNFNKYPVPILIANFVAKFKSND